VAPDLSGRRLPKIQVQENDSTASKWRAMSFLSKHAIDSLEVGREEEEDRDRG